MKGQNMAKEFELTEEMQAQVDKESPAWTFELTTTSVRAFARGVGYTDPVYFDVEAAKAAGYRSLPAPPTYLGTPVFIPGRSSDTFSGPSEGQPSINHGLPNVLDGGTETEYRETLCAGDTVSVTTKITSLEVKESKSTGKMLITTTETVYKNQATENVAAVQRSQVITF
ncbi:MaoC family dehydratase N-terminal domain-containing protein [Myxococcota bacterium]|nr:MaoC family dehydratase N-terminal domain-containing protein [Myxococcota bacterium]|tara:strand:- start:5690 stop:6199 length:510 start_codon:yes stop_codon:yes gene_type:complete